MENPLVQSELQDICTFRKSILDSFEKIQHKIHRTKTPLRLTLNCNCSHQNVPFHPLSTCPFDDQTTHYFSQREHIQTNPDHSNKILDKAYLLDNYLNKYEQNIFNFQVQPLNSNNKISNKNISFSVLSPFNNKNLSGKLNNSTLQITAIPFSNQKLSVTQRKRNSSSNQNHDEILLNHARNQNFSQLKSKLNIKRGSESRQNSLTTRNRNQTERNIMKHHSLYIATKKRSLQQKAGLSKGYQRQKQPFKPNANFQNKQCIRQQIYKRIKKRIYLSSVVYKSTQNSFPMTYQKQLRQRQEILNKIVNNPNIIKKFKKSLPLAE